MRWKTPRYSFDSPQNSWFDYLQHLPESTCLMGAADAARTRKATLGLSGQYMKPILTFSLETINSLFRSQLSSRFLLSHMALLSRTSQLAWPSCISLSTLYNYHLKLAHSQLAQSTTSRSQTRWPDHTPYNLTLALALAYGCPSVLGTKWSISSVLTNPG